MSPVWIGAVVVVTVKPTAVALLVGIAAFAFMWWDYVTEREVPVSQVMNRRQQGKPGFTYPVGNTALVVLALCVVFAAWYVLTGQHWEVRL